MVFGKRVNLGQHLEIQCGVLQPLARHNTATKVSAWEEGGRVGEEEGRRADLLKAIFFAQP